METGCQATGRAEGGPSCDGLSYYASQGPDSCPKGRPREGGYPQEEEEGSRSRREGGRHRLGESRERQKGADRGWGRDRREQTETGGETEGKGGSHR